MQGTLRAKLSSCAARVAAASGAAADALRLRRADRAPRAGRGRRRRSRCRSPRRRSEPRRARASARCAPPRRSRRSSWRRAGRPGAGAAPRRRDPGAAASRACGAVAAPDEDVLDHQVEARAAAAQVLAGAGVDDLDAERVEVEPAARGIDHLGAALDADDAATRGELAHQARRTAAAEPEHQHRTAASGGSQASGAASASQTEPVSAWPGRYDDANVPSTRSESVPRRRSTATRAFGARPCRGPPSLARNPSRGPTLRPATPRCAAASRPCAARRPRGPRDDAYNRPVTSPTSEDLRANPFFSDGFSSDGGVARVALPVPVDELFEYTIPPSCAAKIRPGCRVRVRFGGRSLVGVVVERCEQARFQGRLAAVEAVLDEAPALSAELIAVLRSAAADVLCPIGIALAAALPAGSVPVVARGVALTPRGRAASASGAAAGVAARLLARLADGPLPRSSLLRRGDGAARSALEALRRDGLVAACEIIQKPRARLASQPRASLAPGVDLAAARAALARAPRQLALLERLAADGETATRELAGGALRALRERGFVRVEQRSVSRDVLGAPLEPAAPRRADPRPGRCAEADRGCRARAPRGDLPAARRHRQRQDRGLPAGGRGGAGRGAPGAGAGARDHAHAPDPGPAAGPLRRRPRGAAQRPLARRAPRAVAAAARRPDADRGRRALGALRAARCVRPDRDRRRTRRGLQERRGLPLPRARPGALAGAPGALPAGARLGDAGARDPPRGRPRRAAPPGARPPHRRPAAARPSSSSTWHASASRRRAAASRSCRGGCAARWPRRWARAARRSCS